MPLYEYLCESCGERTEILQRFGDLSEIVCSKCGAAMRKLPSAPSFQFKGSGFYLTDYAKKTGGTEGTSPRSGSDKGGDKGGESSGDKTGDGASAAGAGSSTTSPAPSAAPAGGGATAPAAGGAKPSSSSGTD
jgi:putative FmdB family regulatory protein